MNYSKTLKPNLVGAPYNIKECNSFYYALILIGCHDSKGNGHANNDMKAKYHILRGRNGFLISSIEDSAVQAVTKILCSKVLRKMGPAECTTARVELVEKCAQVVHINWS